jgi:hypothetical protein
MDRPGVVKLVPEPATAGQVPRPAAIAMSRYLGMASASRWAARALVAGLTSPTSTIQTSCRACFGTAVLLGPRLDA